MQALLKYNRNIERNKALRQELNHVRRDRVTFDMIYKNLEDETFKHKKAAAKIEKGMKKVLNARDDIRNTMQKLRTKAGNRASHYQELIKQQVRKLE